MKRIILAAASLMLFANCTTVKPPQITMNTNHISWPSITPPDAEKKLYVRTLHGDVVNDHYYWMNDYFKKGPDSTRVVNYLEAENNYTAAMMRSTDALQADLFTEMKSRIKEKDESVPVFKNGYYYYTRTDEGRQYFKYCRKKGSLDAPEQVLLDVDALAEGHAYFSSAGFSISPDNNMLAYGVDEVSRRQYKMLVKDLSSGQTMETGVQNTQPGYVWANDNKTIFYTANNPATLLSEKIKRHTLGTNASADVDVYTEADNTNYIGVYKTRAENFIIIQSQGTLSSEVRYLDANDPTGTFKVFQPRVKNVLYSIDANDKAFYLRTNKDALNFRIVQAPFNATGIENWVDVIPHRKDVLVEGVTLFKDRMVVSEVKNGLEMIRIINNNGTEKYVEFDEPVYTAGLTGNAEYNSNILRYAYNSLVTPASVYDLDMTTGERKLRKQTEVLGTFNRNDYESERMLVTVTDGTKVPVSIVYKKGFVKDGTKPVLLYAYGSYGISMTPGFNSARLSLLDRGFAYAIAHIRGGEEMGRQWYEDGKMLKKKNTFTDFIDVGKYLVAQKYTSPQHLYAQGGSAGGLLMGAVVNMAPELFNGAIADVPFVDVVTTMMDASIPLTTNEYDEWGNPENKDAYFYMKSYSPYENVSEQAYPNLLVTTGLHDSQVQYFEPAKWVAKLRDMNKSNNVILLKTNMDFGHGGASGRFDYLKDVALRYAFLLKLEGQVP